MEEPKDILACPFLRRTTGAMADGRLAEKWEQRVAFFQDFDDTFGYMKGRADQLEECIREMRRAMRN